MGIKPHFNRESVNRRMIAFLNKIEEKQIDRLKVLGEMCVAHARGVPKEQGFEDQTGNLRSSIGYAVFVDGVAVHSLYELKKGGSEGIRQGQKLAKEIGESSSGMCLVVTAGMNYAAILEAGHTIKKKDGGTVHVLPRDVLASAELLAKRELPLMVERLKDNISRALT